MIWPENVKQALSVVLDSELDNEDFRGDIKDFYVTKKMDDMDVGRMLQRDSGFKKSY